jgi:hypothetical protein
MLTILKRVCILTLIFCSKILFTSAQTLVPGAALLFKDAKTKISDADKNDIFLQTGYYFNTNTKKLLPAKGISDKGFSYKALPADMNHDGAEEILLFSRNMNKSSYKVFIKKSNKYYVAGNLNEPADEPLKVYNEKNYGYNVISASTYSKSPVTYKFNGEAYLEYKNFKPRSQEDFGNDVFTFSLDYTSPIKTISNPDIITAYLFRNIKTKLSATEKKFFASGYAIQYREEADTSVVLLDENKIIGINEGGRVDVDIVAADLNHDGVEEIFKRTNGTFFGQWLQDLVLYIKNKDGKYVVQDSVNSPRLYARVTSNKGYPDLIASEPEGPGFEKLPTKFDVYRWDGTRYNVYKHNQPPLKTDKSIEEVISVVYEKTLPDSLMKNKFVFDELKMDSPVKVVQASKIKESPSTKEMANLSPLATTLFANIKTSLTDKDKNDIALLTGFTENELNAKTKRGKSKIEIKVYPTDFNNDRTEEIFICATTAPLGIPMNTYFFYTKNNNGNYQPSPGKIGQGVKVLLNGKLGFPDLITGTPGLNREVWSWNGGVYSLIKVIPGNVLIPFKTMNIDDAATAYK